MPLPIPKFIKTAFAKIGLRNNIPEATNNTTGAAGYDRGFGEINMLPEGAGGIPPDGKDFNGVLYELSAAIQYIQAGRSFPFNQDFANAIGGYGKGSLVSLDSDLSVVYKSKVDNNLSPPPSANWEVFGEVAQATEEVAGIAKIATQTKVSDGTDDSDFITSKKLKDSGLWPLGYRQTWQNVTASRSAGVTYTNTTGRSIFVRVIYADTWPGVRSISVSGSVVDSQFIASTINSVMALLAIVPAGATYSVAAGSGLYLWTELR